MFWTQDRCPGHFSVLNRSCLGRDPDRLDQAKKNFQLAVFYLPAQIHSTVWNKRVHRCIIPVQWNIMPSVNHCNAEQFLFKKPPEAAAACSCTQLSRSANIPARFYKFWPVQSKAQAFQMRYWHGILSCVDKKSTPGWRITCVRFSYTDQAE